MLCIGEAHFRNSDCGRPGYRYQSKRCGSTSIHVAEVLYDDLWWRRISTFQRICGVPKERRAERKRYVLKMAGIEERRNATENCQAGRSAPRQPRNLHEPPILLTSQPQVSIPWPGGPWDLIYELSGAGNTILSYALHDEAEYCHRLALMYRGKADRVGDAR
jgi:ABC-2 type transport system ATP-binding protein